MSIPTAYQPLFQLFDTDGDGTLDAVELRSALNRLGSNLSESQAKAVLAIVDRDGDGRIQLDEFTMLIDGGGSTPADPEALRGAFNAFDVDGDGFLTADELTTLFRWVGVDAPDDVAAWVAELDLDGNGRVDFEEFVAMSR